jgi:hypothetical protein
MSLTAAKDGNTYIIDYAFKNENGSAVTCISGNWSLRDNNGLIVNSRSAVSILASSAGSIVLTPADLVYEANSSTFRTFTIKAIYDSEYGSACSIAEEASFDITNLIGV